MLQLSRANQKRFLLVPPQLPVGIHKYKYILKKDIVTETRETCCHRDCLSILAISFPVTNKRYGGMVASISPGPKVLGNVYIQYT